MQPKTPKLLEDSRDATAFIEAVAVAAEGYTPNRKAEFLLSNSVDAEDYARAVEEVRRMGLAPAAIPHYKPAV
ncbi:MAG: hypothetical protein H0X37_17580 [Herpetosiphonaceae bacterium]|nr:hypothetical protein [Herpetosiphonaceae bacterium]